MKTQIVPAIIAKNQEEINATLNRDGKYFSHFQLDIMDGKFVKSKSNWFKFKLYKKYAYEAHLMVDEPDHWIKNNYRQFKIIIPNFERIKNPEFLIKFVKSKNKKIGFAINPETKIEKIKPYLSGLDRVLILTVHPGQYGAKFLPRTVSKIKSLRKIYKKDIEVDGHMNPETINLCKKAGANIFAVGAYIKDTKDIKTALQKLKNILR